MQCDRFCPVRACASLGITPLPVHHDLICSKLFDQIVSQPNHKLKSLLPPSNNASYNLRKHRLVALPSLKTNRANDAFIISMVRKSFSM